HPAHELGNGARFPGRTGPAPTGSRASLDAGVLGCRGRISSGPIAPCPSVPSSHGLGNASRPGYGRGRCARRCAPLAGPDDIRPLPNTEAAALGGAFEKHEEVLPELRVA